MTLTLRFPRPSREAIVWTTALGVVLLVLTCAFGMYALRVVGGSWANWCEAERIVRSYSGR